MENLWLYLSLENLWLHFISARSERQPIIANGKSLLGQLYKSIYDFPRGISMKLVDSSKLSVHTAVK